MSTTEPTPADRLAGPWQFLPLHSSVTFSIPYVVVDFRGTFADVSAELADGVLSGTARVDSLSVEHEVLRPHMLGPEFFDAERHPEFGFASSSLSIDGDAVSLAGELTLKGVTRPITAVGTITGPRRDFMDYERIGLTLETGIDRTQFGIDWNAELPEGGPALADEVTIAAMIEFARPVESA